MSIGLVIAMKAEAHALFGRGRWKGGDGEGVYTLKGAGGPEGGSINVALSGVGQKRAAAGASLLLQEGADALLGLGISGGLSPELKAGDLVLASAVMDEGGEIHGLDKGAVEFASKALDNNGISVRQGPIISTEKPLLDGSAKKKFYQKTGALAIDMESAGLASVAAKKGVPFFIMRAVSDEAGEAVSPELYACLDEKFGVVRPGQLLGNCIRRPAMVKEMMRLRRSYNLALSNLGRGWRVLEKAGLLYFLLEKRK